MELGGRDPPPKVGNLLDNVEKQYIYAGRVNEAGSTGCRSELL